MKPDQNKCYILAVKKTTKQHHFELISKFLESKNEKKDLGVIMSTKLSWITNSQKRCQKFSSIYLNETFPF